MRFLLDHDVPGEVALLLRHWGHDIVPLRDALPCTALDEQVFCQAQSDRRILISCNRADFLNLARQALLTQRPFSGLKVLVRRRSRQAECAHLLQLIRRAEVTGLENHVNFA